MIRAVIASLAVLATVTAGAPVRATAASDVVGEFRVIANPFTSDAVSTRHKAGIRLTLLRPAHVTVTIEQAGGQLVKRIAANSRLAAGRYKWSWAGGRDNGTLAQDGDYVAHLKVSRASGTEELSLPVRKGMPPIYPANPGAITVLINPGHGGALLGAHYKSLTEKVLNLDIGLRLRRLLEAAGVNVVMTRTTDVHVPDPEFDVNGDGVVGPTTKGGDDWDGLAYRLDIGNMARADVHIFNHNNAAGCRCWRGTETFTRMARSWTPEGVALATDVQAAQIAQLDTFRNDTFWPIDLGVLDGKKFYTLSPYTLSGPEIEPRPALQPTILTESLFVSDPIERALLKRGAVREAIATGMYLGLLEYFALRDYGIRYELVGGPTVVAAGAAADFQVRITNTGNLTSSGWQLQLHSVPAVPFYDGSDAIGDIMGSVAIPDGLMPGATATLTVHATAPPTAGQWLVKADTLIGGAERPFLSERGVVAMQLPLTTR